jgi:ubiquinone/menaquinone biosynthesis C-methylase UbiE
MKAVETAQSPDPVYVLGHAEHELRRLTMQSDYWILPTMHVLQQAGIEPGMRVLDVGSGAGDVSRLVARMVGPSGSVVGVDRSADAVARARERAAAIALDNVSFIVADLEKPLEVDGEFDAIVGRFVLMYLKNPVSTLRSLQLLARPHGVVAFIELDLEALRTVPPVPFIDLVTRWMLETFRRGHVPTALGPQAWRLFRDAGLVAPSNYVWWEAAPAPAADLTQIFAETTRSIVGMAERFGLTDFAALNMDTLAERFQQELLTARATLLPPAVVGTWARIPR